MTWWQTLLAVIGGLFIGGMLLLVVGVWFLKRKFAQWVQDLGDLGLGAGGSVPPLRIAVAPDSDACWEDDERLAAVTRDLEALGYASLGDFEIDPMYGVPMRGYHHAELGAYAAYLEPHSGDPVLDLVLLFADETALTVTTAPATGLASPPHARKERLPGTLDAAHLGQMHAALVAGRGDAALQPTSADAFAEDYTAAYCREMDWHVERGGPTAEEIRLIAAATSTGDEDGPPEVDEDAIEHVQEMWQSEIGDFAEERMRETYVADLTSISASEWEARRDRLTFISDRMGREQLINRFEDLFVSYDDDIDIEDDDHDFDGAAYQEQLASSRKRVEHAFSSYPTLREGFAALQAELPPHKRYEHLGEVAGEWPGDVYLDPDD